MALAAGDRVTVRGERWVVQDTTAFADTTLLTLASADDQASLRRCRLLAPFDRPVPVHRAPHIRATSPRRWMHHLHAQRSALRAFGELRAPLRAAIDLLPFQLEPALAIARGRASRLLLADEVGLGKTIQAGLVLAELQQRGLCEHALIVTPAGLRQQWSDELWNRFQTRPAVIDAAWLAARVDVLPFDVNPWTVEPVVMTSIDFLKQPEVMRGLSAQVWDLLIVDEAHQATVASLRYQAIHTLAIRARHVMLLTATPHAGDDRAYRALCAIGEVAGRGEDAPGTDRMLLFRRTRQHAGLPRSRRAHLLPVKLTPDGIEMHRLLDDYLARLWSVARESGARDLQLVAMVLGKRAFSSAQSLAASIDRRLAGLAVDVDIPMQTALPFTFEDDGTDEAQLPMAPAFERHEDERAVLERLLDAAQRVQHADRKMHVLRRILRRVDEPVIIFTEYRDTLDAIRGEIGSLRRVTSLHGGQTPHERRESVRAFTSGIADVLIATDAGSEGLNLHGTCRLVVNLELPWNPIRLEQRIGRVDRIGQTRTVHAINLFADGTAERTVLANLLRRLDRIRMSEVDIAACVIDHAVPPPRTITSDTCTHTADLSADGRVEAQRLRDTRRLSTARSTVPDAVAPVTCVKATHPSFVAFFRIRLVSHAGRLLEEDLVPVCVPIAPPPRHPGRKSVRALTEALMNRWGGALLRRAREYGNQRARTLASEAARSAATAASRERGIAEGVAARGAPLVQAGLFDSRVVKQKWAEDEHRDLLRRESAEHANRLDANSRVHLATDPELVMLLIRCSQG
ncbi:MAG TPA: helicase-related protein [Vicinamibacterales bacterium]|nr:helicase-related protein [Vicinamibacterales bacterium]